MRSREVILGGIYRHIDGLTYQVNKIGLDTTGYERTHRVRRSVHYTQLENGDYPAGAQWTKLEKDFLRRVRREGRSIPVFELIQEKG